MKTPPFISIVQVGAGAVCLYRPTASSIPEQIRELASCAESELGPAAFAAIEKASSNGLAALPNLACALAFELGRQHGGGRARAIASAGSGTAVATPGAKAPATNPPNKTREEIRAEFEAILDPLAKSEFYRLNRQHLV
jgi:hypothetical protein